jgi:hypothetical protein
VTEKNIKEHQSEEPVSRPTYLAVDGRILLKIDIKDIDCERVFLTELACKEG